MHINVGYDISTKNPYLFYDAKLQSSKFLLKNIGSDFLFFIINASKYLYQSSVFLSLNVLFYLNFVLVSSLICLLIVCLCLSICVRRLQSAYASQFKNKCITTVWTNSFWRGSNSHCNMSHYWKFVRHFITWGQKVVGQNCSS